MKFKLAPKSGLETSARIRVGCCSLLAVMVCVCASPSVLAQGTSITIQTNPPGLQFTVDGGASQAAPQTLTLGQGPHTLAVATTQAGAPGTQYLFTGWSDGGAASHTITVGASPATYTATFKTQYQLTISASPPADGTVSPVSGGFYDSGTVVPISATANAGYSFTIWTGSVASPNSASTTVTMTGPQTVTANFDLGGLITVQTNPTGLQFTVDGGASQAAPQTLNLSQGTHTLAVATPQTGPPGTQYIFTGWNDGGAASHTITVGASSATYTATFNSQYQLTISASPPADGTVTPARGGSYDSGTVVPITATANGGFSFINWTGSVASANSASTTVTMTGPQTVTANFVSGGLVTVQTNPAGLQFIVDGGASQTAPQTLNLSLGPHTLAVATTQAGAPGTQYVFTAWSDGGAASHTITVGSPATYTATFKTQYQLTISASPPADGTVTPVSGGFYDSGTVVPVTATANGGFSFTNWTGSIANPNSASTTVTMSSTQTVTANFVSGGLITVQTIPTGLQFSVDGGASQTAPQTLSLTLGSHTLGVATLQAGAPGTQYVFTGWSDGGAASHTITVASSATYTATFRTQYQLTISASPAADGTVTPVSGGFYDAGTVVPITATANGGFSFINWIGSVASPSSASTTVTMNSPQTVTAIMSVVGDPACTADATTLCLSSGRFKVQAHWATPDGRSGNGQAILLTGDTGHFWFFGPNNVEMVVKVLNACGINSQFWVFAGGLTNVQVDLTVSDTLTHTVKTYRNPQNTAFLPIQDTGAFATCAAGSTALLPDLSEERAVTPTSVEKTVPRAEVSPLLSAAAFPACTDDATTLCLSGGRFKVQTHWSTSDGGSGNGQAISLSGDTGYFWFFNSSNVEMIVKVLNACSFASRIWVFAGGLTNVQVDLTVTDTQTGTVQTYRNPQSTAFLPIQDTNAFSICP